MVQGDQAGLMDLESLHCPGNEPPSKVSGALPPSLPLTHTGRTRDPGHGAR